MSEFKIKKFSFSERVQLNAEMDALMEGPYVRWRDTEESVEPQLPNVDVDAGLQPEETNLLNRFNDGTLSDVAYETISAALMSGIEVDEAVATAPRVANIRKGDWVQFRDGEITKVQDVSRGSVRVKKEDGTRGTIDVRRLSRIGKFKGKAAFGFLSLSRD